MTLVDVKDIVRMLQARAESVCTALYGVRVHKKSRLMLGDVSGNDGQSLSILLKHTGKFRPGDWRDWSTGDHGDILDLIAQAKYNGNRSEAMQWARQFLGIDRGDPAKLAAEKKQLEQREKKQRQEADAAEARRINVARRIFVYQSQAQIEGTPVDYYLMGRGIDLRQMGSTGAIRFCPDCLWNDTGELLPAMVAAIVGGDGKITAIHRTYLECVEGRWKVIKDPQKNGKLKSRKFSLGSVEGGHISVSKGAADVPMGRAPQGDRVLIAEGYETAASYAIACPDLRVVASVSLGNMATIVVPPQITTRFLVKENGMGKQAEFFFQRALEAHQRQCPDVRVVETEPGFSDANDMLMNRRLSA